MDDTYTTMLSARIPNKIDLEDLVKKFPLDNNTGFVKVSYYKLKKPEGGLRNKNTVAFRVERPPQRIKKGCFCTECESSTVHSDTCTDPYNNLVVTVDTFKEEIIDKDTLSSRKSTESTKRLKTLKAKWLSGKLDSSEYFQPGSIKTQSSGTVVVEPNAPTEIKCVEVFPKHGKAKGFIDETGTFKDRFDWPNAVILQYLKDNGRRSQIRIHNQGTGTEILMSHFVHPHDVIRRDLNRKLTKITGKKFEELRKPNVRHIQVVTKVLSNKFLGQMGGTKIDILNLSEGIPKLFVEKKSGNYLMLDGLSGILVLDPYPSIDPSDGKGKFSFRMEYGAIYIYAMIYPKGTMQLNLSYINKESKSRALTKELATQIKQGLVKLISDVIVEVHVDDSKTQIDNTFSGKALPKRKSAKNTSVCKGKRGDIYYRPEPYSFKGRCANANYTVLPLEGFEGTDDKWYPCCGTPGKGPKKSEEALRDTLINGFPRNEEEARKYNIPWDPKDPDMGSGLLQPDFNKRGTKISYMTDDNKIKVVNMFSPVKEMPRGQHFIVDSDEGKIKIKRSQIIPETRRIVGLNPLLEQRSIQFKEKFGSDADAKYNEYLCSLIDHVRPNYCNDSQNIFRPDLDILDKNYIYLNELVFGKELLENRYSAASIHNDSIIVGLLVTDEGTDLIDTEQMTVIMSFTRKISKSIKVIGHLYRKKVYLWKKFPAEVTRLFKKYEQVITQDNIVNAASNFLNDTHGLVFIPTTKGPFILYINRRQNRAPVICLQALTAQNSNNQTVTWSMGFGGKALPNRCILTYAGQGVKPGISVKIKRKQFNVEERDWLLLRPNYLKSGKIPENTKPFEVISEINTAIPVQKIKNSTLNLLCTLVNPISQKALTPVKHGKTLAFHILEKHYKVDESSGLLKKV